MVDERNILIREGCVEVFLKMIDCYNENIEVFKKNNKIEAFYFGELCQINIVLLGSLIEKFMSMINDAALFEMKSRNVTYDVHNKQMEMIKNRFAFDLLKTLEQCFQPLEKEMAVN